MIFLSGVYSEITCQIKKSVYLILSEKGEKVRRKSELFKFKSQPFYQRYKSNLPTSLTHITLYNYKLLALGTCCGLLYGSCLQIVKDNKLSNKVLNRCFKTNLKLCPQNIKCFILPILKNPLLYIKYFRGFIEAAMLASIVKKKRYFSRTFKLS